MTGVMRYYALRRNASRGTQLVTDMRPMCRNNVCLQQRDEDRILQEKIHKYTCREGKKETGQECLHPTVLCLEHAGVI